jgi:hypothetical protein
MARSLTFAGMAAALSSAAARNADKATSPVDAFASEFVGIEYGSDLAMTLQMLNNTQTSGAVCLDGTPAGFYFAPAANAAASKSWRVAASLAHACLLVCCRWWWCDCR